MIEFILLGVWIGLVVTDLSERLYEATKFQEGGERWIIIQLQTG